MKLNFLGCCHGVANPKISFESSNAELQNGLAILQLGITGSGFEYTKMRRHFCVFV